MYVGAQTSEPLPKVGDDIPPSFGPAAWNPGRSPFRGFGPGVEPGPPFGEEPVRMTVARTPCAADLRARTNGDRDRGGAYPPSAAVERGEGRVARRVEPSLAGRMEAVGPRRSIDSVVGWGGEQALPRRIVKSVLFLLGCSPGFAEGGNSGIRPLSHRDVAHPLAKAACVEKPPPVRMGRQGCGRYRRLPPPYRQGHRIFSGSSDGVLPRGRRCS